MEQRLSEIQLICTKSIEESWGGMAPMLENPWWTNWIILCHINLQFEDDLSIASVILPINSATITLDTASTIESSSMLPQTNTTYIWSDLAFTCDAPSSSTTITIRLHRVNLLEEMIGQFKDEILLKHNLRYTYIDESGADTDSISRDVMLPSGQSYWTTQLKGRTWGFQFCALSGKKRSGNPLVEFC